MKGNRKGENPGGSKMTGMVEPHVEDSLYDMPIPESRRFGDGK